MTKPNEIKTIQELRKKIAVSFPKGLSEANYDYENYQSNTIESQDRFIDFLVEKLGKSREDLETEFEQKTKTL